MKDTSEDTIPEKSESLEFKRRIVELFEIGLDADDIYAWHGTSWEAIQCLSENGRLPTDGAHGENFYYSPVGLGSYEGDQQEDAIGYANLLAADYYIICKLTLIVNNRSNFIEICERGMEREKFIREEVIPQGIDEEFARKIIGEARSERKGILIALSKRILDDFNEKPGDENTDKRIFVKDGLPIEYLTGLEPLGQFEWEELEKLQNDIALNL